MTDAIETLLSPASVALVGASDNPARIGGRPLRYLRDGGFKGGVYPINPKRDTVQGMKSYAALADLPEAPDTAILAVPASATLRAVEDCAARGVRSAIVFSAGFAETGAEGAAQQKRMTGLAKEAGLRLLGPNCLGVFNPAKGYYGTFSVILDEQFIMPGPVGIVSQSGAYGAHLAHLARKRGLGVSHWITTGNEADIDVAEALHWMVRQDETRVVMAYAEGVQDRDVFIKALETARDNGKAVVFMKTGRSTVGAEAAASHTAALAGSDEVFDAVLRQYGVHRAATTAEQIDIAYACAAGRYPAGNRIGIFTLSGGFGIQLADDSAAAGLDVSPMPREAQEKLLALLPYASPRNPVDATAQAATDMNLITSSVEAMVTMGGYDVFTAILGAGPASPTFAEPLRSAIMQGVAASPHSIRSVTMSAPEDVVRSYEAEGFLVYEDGSALASSLGALVRFSDSFARKDKEAPPAPMSPVPLPDSGAMSEVTAKVILTEAGLSFPAERLASTPDEAVKAAEQIGYPVVLKICSPDIAHKTEISGVAVNLRDAQTVRDNAEAILARAAEMRPNARVEGLIVAPMLGDGVETIVGVAQDSVLGPVVMFGLGGIFVEVLKDVTFRAAPFGLEEARRMIREIKGFPLLEGVRGAGRSDIEALAQLLSDLSRFAYAHRDQIDSIDLNPVRVMPEGQGAVALDALIVRKEECEQ
ncbi:acetate--CoA ligase family protein [Hoeflea sp. WL0058]|uniref:Acetate--CoA ligase family protein n=1 Tax=Flavimaribacter sediminis TaxID=2865987 RepID=A0AAE2ZUL8_9HYPH|nr:acetate--CoA ligase family protein [Flavimaribacter sediminis]MBW8640693.1 acetate--CoA ligase family protein [Flavimaribacter sediminis]